MRGMEGSGWGTGGGAWVWRRRLFAWEEESVRECYLLLHNIVFQDSVHDTWRWDLDPIHGYTVREAYRFFTSTGDLADRSLVDDIWHKQVPSKVSLMVWVSVITCQLETICCVAVFFFPHQCRVLLVVIVLNRQLIYSFIVRRQYIFGRLF